MLVFVSLGQMLWFFLRAIYTLSEKQKNQKSWSACKWFGSFVLGIKPNTITPLIVSLLSTDKYSENVVLISSFFCFFLCAYVELVHAMNMHHLTHQTQHNLGSPLQLSLPDTRVHYCSLTSTSSQMTAGFSPSVVFFFVICCHWMVWCETVRGCVPRLLLLGFMYVWGSVWLYNNWVLTPKLSNLCVCASV